jgi:AcrR family transcriptional regulator
VKAYARLTPATRRAQLLEVGKRVFLERPYEELSMDELAVLSGVSKGLLYHYFPTKREFYMAVLNAAVDEMIVIVNPRPGLAPAEQLRVALDGYLRYVDEHALSYQAVLRGGIGGDPDVVAIADRFRNAAYELILSQAPDVTPLLGLAVRGWIGFVEAVSLEWLRTRRPARSEFVSLLIDTLTDALRVWGGGSG